MTILKKAFYRTCCWRTIPFVYLQCQGWWERWWMCYEGNCCKI